MASAAINNSLQIVAELAAGDTSNTGYSFTVPRACKVIDIITVSNSATTGSATVGKGAAAIATVNFGAAGVVTRAATLTQANVTFAAGDTLRLTKSNDASTGTVVISLSVDGAALASV